MDPLTTSSGDLIADRRYRFGRDFAGRGDFSAAADLFAQAVEAAPRFAPAWLALAETKVKLGDMAGAVRAFREALRVDPEDHCGAALPLARLGAGDAAQAMSGAYLRTLFDQYAARFDEALERLAYRGPQCLHDACERYCRDASRAAAFGEALDLGCGTGLAGVAFRPLVRRLTGIDLSPAMVAQARGKQIYDRLETGDLLRFLAAEKDRGAAYDLVIAADVFVYLFDLAPAAAAVALVLGPGGLFAFTVEAGRQGVELAETLRYRHDGDHVRGALAAAALRLIELAPITPRTEAGEAVPGVLVLAGHRVPKLASAYGLD